MPRWRALNHATIGGMSHTTEATATHVRQPGHHNSPRTTTAETRWSALYDPCAGALQVVLDATIVNVALPSIQDDRR